LLERTSIITWLKLEEKTLKKSTIFFPCQENFRLNEREREKGEGKDET